MFDVFSSGILFLSDEEMLRFEKKCRFFWSDFNSVCFCVSAGCKQLLKGPVVSLPAVEGTVSASLTFHQPVSGGIQSRGRSHAAACSSGCSNRMQAFVVAFSFRPLSGSRSRNLSCTLQGSAPEGAHNHFLWLQNISITHTCVIRGLTRAVSWKDKLWSTWILFKRPNGVFYINEIIRSLLEHRIQFFRLLGPKGGSRRCFSASVLTADGIQII